jgi:hypothetical protein
MTNTIIKSTDRELYGVVIRQRTDNSFLCLSDMTDAYHVARIKNSWSDRNIEDITRNKIFLERLYHLLFKRNIINLHISGFMENLSYKGFPKYMKELNLYRTYGARETRAVWCDPYLFVMLTMELNPEIYAQTILWVTDNLVFARVEAGNNWKPLTDAIKSKFNPIDETPYIKIAIAINNKIFEKHIPGVRSIASKQELARIVKIEEMLANMIELEMLKNDRDTVEAIKNIKV